METDYIKLLSAALTPILGILTAYIAWQQWRINHLKVRHDLYERRLAVYLALMEFLACISRGTKATDAEMIRFLQKTRESYFLFDPSLAEYLDKIYDQSVELQYLSTMLDGPGSSLPVGEERNQAARKRREKMVWFNAQAKVARDEFAWYMRLS